MPPLIGEGSYGCVFDPPIPCKGDKKQKKTTVGKVFIDEDEFKSELNLNKIVKKIDPDSEFTVPLRNSCRVQEMDDNETYKQCELFRHFHGDVSSLNQLIYENGGVSIKDVMEERGSIKKLKQILKSMHHVVHGLKKLIDAGYVHQDIKPANILWRSKKKQIFLIDFGIMSKRHDVYRPENKFILRYDYPFYPPEYKLFVYKSYYIFYMKVLANYKHTSNVNLLHEINKIGIDYKQQLKDLFEEKNSKSYQQTDKIDIFSLGIVLLELYIWSRVHHQEHSKFKESYQALLRGMLSFNVFTRFNIDQTIEAFETLLSFK